MCLHLLFRWHILSTLRAFRFIRCAPPRNLSNVPLLSPHQSRSLSSAMLSRRPSMWASATAKERLFPTKIGRCLREHNALKPHLMKWLAAKERALLQTLRLAPSYFIRCPRSGRLSRWSAGKPPPPQAASASPSLCVGFPVECELLCRSTCLTAAKSPCCDFV